MKSILIIQNLIPHYRVPFYEELNKKYNLTILHSGSKVNDVNFHQIIVKKYKFWKFFYQKNTLSIAKRKEYNKIILMFDIAWVSNVLILLLHKNKTILWGNRYSKNKVAILFRNILMKYSKGIIQYSNREVKRMISYGIESQKIHIAHNTMYIYNNEDTSNFKKKTLIFVGRAQKRKKVDVFLRAFSEIQYELPKEVTIEIIGSGKENDFLKELVKELNIEKRVKFLGKITDNLVLKEHFSKAFAYVSPGPVGLSVLHSFSYGVPVITLREGKHGPEITNIKNGENGIIVNDYNAFKNQLKRLVLDKDFSKKIGQNAYSHFKNNRSIENMEKGFVSAIEA